MKKRIYHRCLASSMAPNVFGARADKATVRREGAKACKNMQNDMIIRYDMFEICF